MAITGTVVPFSLLSDLLREIGFQRTFKQRAVNSICCLITCNQRLPSLLCKGSLGARINELKQRVIAENPHRYAVAVPRKLHSSFHMSVWLLCCVPSLATNQIILIQLSCCCHYFMSLILFIRYFIEIKQTHLTVILLMQTPLGRRRVMRRREWSTTLSPNRRLTPMLRTTSESVVR